MDQLPNEIQCLIYDFAKDLNKYPLNSDVIDIIMDYKLSMDIHDLHQQMNEEITEWFEWENEPLF